MIEPRHPTRCQVFKNQKIELMVRKFKIFDVIILVIAFSFGLKWSKYFYDIQIIEENYPYCDPIEIPKQLCYAKILSWWLIVSSHCVAVITLAILILRFCGRGIEFLCLACQPGTIACGAVLFAVILDITDAVSLLSCGYLKEFKYIDEKYALGRFYLGVHNEGVAVAVAWSSLAICGRWRVGRDWVDRVGIALGVLWIVMPAIHWIIENIFYHCFRR
jgi:hypothetical protein